MIYQNNYERCGDCKHCKQWFPDIFKDVWYCEICDEETFIDTYACDNFKKIIAEVEDVLQ